MLRYILPIIIFVNDNSLKAVPTKGTIPYDF